MNLNNMRPLFRALAKAKPGQRFRRGSWSPGRYLALGTNGQFRAVSREGDQGPVYRLPREDVLAKDWAKDWALEGLSVLRNREKRGRPKVQA